MGKRRTARALAAFVLCSLPGVLMAPPAAAAPTAPRIVFVRHGDLFTVLPDGSGVRQLTQTPRREGIPVWGPGHGRIAFTVGDRELWIMHADGSYGHRILRLADTTLSLADIAWSPSGRRLALGIIRERGTPFHLCGLISMLRSDGSGAHYVLRGQLSINGLDWSPHGVWLTPAFEQFSTTLPCRAGARTGLWKLHPDGSGLRTLHAPAGRNPNWYPTGRRIVFEDWRNVCHACGEIWKMRRDGTHQAVLASPVDPYYAFRRPRWSPSGSRIAFLALRGSGGELWVMRADGTDRHLLTMHVTNLDW
jgi:Tol biopolymer transport system component